VSLTLADWDVRLRSVFGLSLLSHPARLRDGIDAACKELAVDEAELLARVDRRDRSALGAVARGVTIGETYFFREPQQIDVVRTQLLPAALERSSHTPVVMLSAGCSSGEEAYTLATLARELLGADASNRVRVLGFDVNERSLATARRAVYRPWSLRGVPREVQDRWFDKVEDGVRVVPQVRALVTFERRNLVDPTDALPAGTADIILCRNVLIYLDDASVNAALQMLATALRPSGSLILGSAEGALLTAAGLGAQDAGGVWVHTKGAPVAPYVIPSTPPPATARIAPTRTSAAPPRRRAPVAAPLEREAKQAPAPAEEETAARCVERGFAVLASSPEDAAKEVRRALLLDRTLASAHVLAASVALSQGQLEAARRSLRHARRHLAEVAPCSIVAGAGGATAAELTAYCDRLARAAKDAGR